MAICGHFGRGELKAYIVGGNVVGNTKTQKKVVPLLKYGVWDAFPGEVV